MERKILQFRSREKESDAQTRRNREQRLVRRSPKLVTPLEAISMEARKQYMLHVDRIRRASIETLSSEPYNAWGNPESR